uniref:NADH-ubiquinone oxidoreductase chain 4 n=1 Tax=Snellenius sp. SNS-2016 TaxID=1911514 RepID=A0A6F8AUK0_9HYME|nr:NADH dehydrogenase subunit 4 [Snellenius sp. SNS-2016]
MLMMKFIFMLIMMNFLINKKNIKLFKNLIMLIIMFNWIMNMNLNNFYYNNIYYFLSYDFISFNLIFLSIWIIYLSYLSNFKFNLIMYSKYLNFILINLLTILTLCFLSMNFLLFYIFFESSIIPMMILIMGWGLQIDRIQASMYLLFYTLFGSLPLLMMMFYLYKNFSTLMFNFMIMKNLNLNLNFLFYLFLILAFLIKMPMYFFHLWLPKAHVEAPISGSMILAGIMLKLGSYGLIRMMMLMKFLFMNFNLFLMNLSIIGGIYASMLCLNINDYKIIVAYSSIVHMSSLMCSMLTFNFWGYIGSYIMMLAHGLCSSCMFCLVNFNYERIHSRSTNLMKGMINLIPSISLWWFLICIINMSSPPSMNLISEIMIFNSLISWSNYFMIYLLIMTFLSSCYTIFIYAFSQHGKFNFNLYNFFFINSREYLIILNHWIPLNFFILNLNILFYLMNKN